MDTGRLLEILMDTSTVIVVGTIVGAVITGLFGMGKVQEKVEKVKEILGKDHDGLEKTINKGNEQLNMSIKEAAGKILNIDKMLAVEAKTKEMLYQSLDKDQQEIKRHVEGINALVRNWEEVNMRNKELEKQVSQLENRVNELKAKIHILERKDRGNRDRGDN